MAADTTSKGNIMDNKATTEDNEKPSEVVVLSSSEQLMEKDWTDDEERRIIRKLDFLLMPLLVLGFFALQLDRTNISNALTSTIAKDLDISSDTINSGNQLQIAAIIIFEIPANIILQYFGASVWITAQALLWGSVALFQGFITNKESFYATRFLLGMFEAGYIPGSMYVISLFYKRQELARRYAVFYIGNYFAAGTGSLIAAGVLNLSGRSGLGGWQWLFIIDGLFTVVVGLIFILLLPSSPLRTLPLCKIQAFDLYTDRDRHIMHHRVILDDAYKEVALTELTWRDVVKALSNIRLWGHLAINILSLAPKGGLQLYSPTVNRALGFDRTAANALASISNYGVIILSLSVAWASDKTKMRGLWCLIPGTYSVIFAGVQFSMVSSNHKWTEFAIFTLLNSGNAVAQGINDAWLSSNCQTPQNRSIGLALAVMGSNLGGLAGQQLFRASDAPRYNMAFLSILCLYGSSLVMVSIQMCLYWYSNKKLDKYHREAEGESQEMAEATVSWRYEL